MSDGPEPVPDLSICIVNWNTREDLARCLNSIDGAAATLRVETIVVDNASSDGSATMVGEHFPHVRVIANGGNYGFAHASNQGLRMSRAPYALLLNPDITVHPDALHHLVVFMRANPACGAATGMLLLEDGEFQWYYYRSDHGLLAWVTELCNRLTWNLVPNLVSRFAAAHFDRKSPGRLDMLPGGCMVVRAEVCAQAGLLDEDFFLLYEDVEWCRRIRNAGWDLCYCPAAVFTHTGGRSFQGWSQAQQGAQCLQSCLLFLDKHYPRPVMVLVRVHFLVNFLIHFAAFSVARALPARFGHGSLTWRQRWQWIRIILTPPRRIRRAVGRAPDRA